MKIIFTKRNFFILVASSVLGVIFAIVLFLSQNKEIPIKEILAPYNQFNYSYITASDHGIYHSYINQTLIQSTSTHSEIFSDGKGFYQFQRQTEQPTPCGDQQLNAESNLDSVGQGCVSVDGKDYIAADIYYVNSNYVVYEQCQKMSFYPSYGKNDCKEYSLKVNNVIIDTSYEGYDNLNNTLSWAPKFREVKVGGNMLSYVKSYESPDMFFGKEEFKAYNLLSKTKKIQYLPPDNSRIVNAQLVDNKPVVLLRSYSGVNISELNGMSMDDRAKYFYDSIENALSPLLFEDGKKLDNVSAFASNNGHLYFLQKNTIASASNYVPSTILFKDTLGVLGFTPQPGQVPPSLSIKIYPDCNNYSSVCLYNNSDYLAIAENMSPLPLTYYPNGVETQYSFSPGDGFSTQPFVFSSHGDTYWIYSHQGTIYGQNISQKGQPVKLFKEGLSDTNTIVYMRVFPK